MPNLIKFYILNIIKNLKNKFFKKENIFFAVVIFFIFFLDRLSKNLIISNFRENLIFINDFLNFDLIWNTGIGFGLFSSNSDLFYNFITIIIGFVIIFLIYISLNLDKLEKIIYCLIIGGAIGNFYDRLIFKAVPDFIDLHYNDFHWFTFNVADIFISFGIIAFILRSFFVKN